MRSSFVTRGLGVALCAVVSLTCGRSPSWIGPVSTDGTDAGATGGATGGTTGPAGSGGGVQPPGTGGAGATGPTGSAGSGTTCSSEITGGTTGRVAPGSPVFTGLPTAAVPPPPISGGTLLALRNGTMAVAADPDRDAIYLVDLSDLSAPALKQTIALEPHDEPGRLVEDGAGLVHVVLRNAQAVVTVDPATGKVTMRRSTCALPRGIAYDAAKDRLHVACATGTLLTFVPTSATPERTLKLDSDLRDVVVDGARLLVSRFRSAEMLVVDADGKITERIRPPEFSDASVAAGVPFEPVVAWRAVGRPGGGAVMMHQRGHKGHAGRGRGGYGSGCSSIVHSAATYVRAGTAAVAGPAIPDMPLPVDVALSPDGTKIAILSAANSRMGSPSLARQLFVTGTDDVTLPWTGMCGRDGRHGPGRPGCPTVRGAGGTSGSSGSGGRPAPATGGAGGTDAGGAGGRGGSATTPPTICTDVPPSREPTAVAFLGSNTYLVQTRQPAELWILPEGDTVQGQPLPSSSVTLSLDARVDLGHAIFHSNSGASLACASCHPEGHEDGRVWEFECEGPRRTQDIGGGISGTEPFHWDGMQTDFSKLVNTVFVGRMSGPPLQAAESAAALAWINSLGARPALRDAADAAVVRGREIFNDEQVACASCHTGDLLTNNLSVDVGTAGTFQVPSLRGVAWRAPYMHNGCAADLAARFGAGACGGTAHGNTSSLTADQLSDLIAYLESL